MECCIQRAKRYGEVMPYYVCSINLTIELLTGFSKNYLMVTDEALSVETN